MKKYQIGLTAVIVCMGIILTACTNKTLEKKEEDILPKQEIMIQDNQTKETIIQGKLMETTEVYQVYELNLEREGLKIFGNLLKPRGEEQYPLMILSHGFGSSYRYTLQYARELVELGIACYVFDFCGGSMNSMSDGEMINMSVITEKNDLSTILDQLKMYDWVDQDKIYLMGESQGGLVSTLLASERSDEIAGLLLLYPAFIIPDNARDLFTKVSEIPEKVEILNSTVGRKYYEDIIDLDVWEQMKRYTGEVIILHGTEDTLVPIEGSKKAIEIFNNARLIEVEGVGHGFHGNDFENAIKLINSNLFSDW